MEITKKTTSQQKIDQSSQFEKKNYSDLLSNDTISFKDVIKGDGLNRLEAISQHAYQVINIPSRGWTYSDKSVLSTGQIRMKLPTGKEQAILSSQNLIRKGIMIDEFLRAIILDSINLDDLLIGDKSYLTFVARRLTYGDDYNVVTQCPKCGKNNKISFDLKSIPLKQTPELFEHPQSTNQFEYTLPNSGKIVRFKLLDGHLQKLIDKRITASKVQNIQILIRTASLITYFDGSTQYNTILMQLKDAPSKDILALRLYMQQLTPDIIIRTQVQCSNRLCGREQEVTVPITVQFFWPSYNN